MICRVECRLCRSGMKLGLLRVCDQGELCKGRTRVDREQSPVERQLAGVKEVLSRNRWRQTVTCQKGKKLGG